MEFLKYFLYTEAFFWTILPFRQKGKKYFYYFYCLASMEALTLFSRLILHSTTNYFYVPISFLALLSIQDSRYLKKYRVIILSLFIAICIANFSKFMITNFFLIMSITYFMILIKLLKDFITFLVFNNTINIFLIVLIFDEITVVTKSLNLVSTLSNEYLSYYIMTSSFEVLVGIFFLIFTDDNPRLFHKLKMQNIRY
jgi:hypothetical protein